MWEWFRATVSWATWPFARLVHGPMQAVLFIPQVYQISSGFTHALEVHAETTFSFSFSIFCVAFYGFLGFFFLIFFPFSSFSFFKINYVIMMSFISCFSLCEFFFFFIFHFLCVCFFCCVTDGDCISIGKQQGR